MSSCRSPEQSRILKNFYFPVQPLAKFGPFLFWMISSPPTWQNCKKKKIPDHISLKFVVCWGLTDRNKVLGVAIACSNTFGLVTGAFLLGFGLVEIPRSMWRNADLQYRQKVLSHKIAKVAVKLDDAHQELSTAIVVYFTLSLLQVPFFFAAVWNFLLHSSYCSWLASYIVRHVVCCSVQNLMSRACLCAHSLGDCTSNFQPNVKAWLITPLYGCDWWDHDTNGMSPPHASILLQQSNVFWNLCLWQMNSLKLQQDSCTNLAGMDWFVLINWQVNDFAGEGGSSIQTIRWKNGWKWHGLWHRWKIHGCTQEAPSQSTEFLLPVQKVNSIMQYPPGSFFFSSWVFFDPMPIFYLQWCVLVLKWVQQQLSACYNCVSPCALVFLDDLVWSEVAARVNDDDSLGLAVIIQDMCGKPWSWRKQWRIWNGGKFLLTGISFLSVFWDLGSSLFPCSLVCCRDLKLQ